MLVDDSHFALAGLDPAPLGGYDLTEEQGAVLGVVPIDQRLGYLIPFAGVDDNLRYLDERGARVLTVVDDGEKFGAWPGTYRHVYEDGWFDGFFDRVLETHLPLGGRWAVQWRLLTWRLDDRGADAELVVALDVSHP